MFKNKITLLFIVFLTIQIFYGCSGLASSVSSADINNKFWEKADSELAADSLVNTILRSEWLKSSKKRKPIIIVGKIINNSNEKLDSDLIEKNIERSFLNSGKITFIPSKAKRELIRSDRMYSGDFPNKREFKKILKPLKSDYFIDGKLDLKIDSLSNPIIKEYELSIQIIKSKNVKKVVTTSVKIIK